MLNDRLKLRIAFNEPRYAQHNANVIYSKFQTEITLSSLESHSVFALVEHGARLKVTVFELVEQVGRAPTK